MKYYVAALKKYAVFSGRASKKEFWMFVLFNILVSLVLGIFDYILGTTYGPREIGILSSIYSLVVFLPSLGVAIRRLHDIGNIGWWVFISLVPIIGIIWYVIIMSKNGDPAENAFGPVPETSPAL
ncbi:MAG: DUF805 domain-containing protein [Anaerolineaceae bacterium]